MASEQETDDVEQCIRCDEEIEVGFDHLGEYIPLTFNHEAGALPVCRDCFDEVKGRDLWAQR